MAEEFVRKEHFDEFALRMDERFLGIEKRMEQGFAHTQKSRERNIVHVNRRFDSIERSLSDIRVGMRQMRHGVDWSPCVHCPWLPGPAGKGVSVPGDVMNTWAAAGRLGCGRSGRRLPLRFAPHGNGRRDHASLSRRRLRSHGEGAYTPPTDGLPGRVWINRDQYFEGVTPATWTFAIGGYRPAEKWLKKPQGPRPVVRRHHPLPYPLRGTRRNAGPHGPNRRNHRRPWRLAAYLLTGKSPNQGRLKPCKYNTTST